MGSQIVLLALVLLGLVSPVSTVSSVRVGLLAVTSGEVGVVVPVDVGLRWPGTGVVEISPLGLVEEDTLSSSIVAFYLAAFLTRHDPLSYDGRVVFETREEVSGASGSGFLAAIFMLLFSGLLPREDVSMTGALSPLGVILPVRGVEAKIAAAESKGYDMVIIPFGEYNVSNVSTRIVKACNVFDAVNWLSGYGAINAPEPTYPKEFFEKAFQDDAVFFGEIINKTMGGTGLVNFTLYHEAFRRGDYYEAASLAFTQLINSNLSADAIIANLGYDSVSSVMRDALYAVSSLRKLVFNGDIVDLFGFIVLASAEKRLYIAENMFSANKTRMALLRALTAISWVSVYNETNIRGPYVFKERLRHGVELLLRYTELVLRYAESIAGKVKMVDGRWAGDWLTDARQALMIGLLARAYAIVVEVLSTIELTVFLHSMIVQEGIEEAYKCVRETVMWYMSMLASYPSLLAYPQALYDYGVNYVEDEPARVSLAASLAAILFGVIVLIGQAGASGIVEAMEASGINVFIALVLVGVATGILGFSLARLARKEIEEAAWPPFTP